MTHTDQLCDVTSDPQGHIWNMRLLKVCLPPGAAAGAAAGGGSGHLVFSALNARGRQDLAEGGQVSLVLLALRGGGNAYSNDSDTVQNRPPPQSSAARHPSAQPLSGPCAAPLCQTAASLPSGAPGLAGERDTE